MGSRRYGRYEIETSNEDKPLFPDTGITKGQLIDYYEKIAEVMLPHVKKHPMVLQRFPDGIAKGGFYQKQAADYFPDWIPTVTVKKEGGTQDLVVCDNAATLAYLANQACISLHPWLSRTDKIDHPDLLVVDLDPPGADFDQVRVAARRCRTLLEDELGMTTFLKLTGSKGVHVVVPLSRREDFETVRAFARDAVDVLACRHPRELTTEHRKAKRRGRVYLDVARNAYAQTAVAPYSVRPLPGAPVAAPIEWDEISSRKLGPRSFTIKNVFRRLASRDAPWAAMRRSARSLASARKRLDGLRDEDR